jgi:glycine cleavage system aminomethyltransferase T
LKQLIALATVDAPYFNEGTRLRMEITIDGARHFVGASVVRTPFLDPPRKTETPPQ